ncbi:hypothetical protein BDV30DRAFT_157253 [Aspergillus minisclerotigenes]|uniref:Uncharacterized protein n=1 Tax=Aspergillus minisclerotigenes TaxID=656917 RepID=A0A5N6IY93_9EURO|nr:hypothetical protein BDV30DRAFT_157253 [Aspergillus minisclerotigenes]
MQYENWMARVVVLHTMIWTLRKHVSTIGNWRRKMARVASGEVLRHARLFPLWYFMFSVALAPLLLCEEDWTTFEGHRAARGRWTTETQRRRLSSRRSGWGFFECACLVFDI